MILQCTAKVKQLLTQHIITSSSPLKKSNDGSVKSGQGYTEGAS